MLFSIYINQKVALEWGLKMNDAAVFSVIYAAAEWADWHGDYWNISKGKIVDELPMVTDKTDTIYRIQNKLISKKLIEKKVIETKDFFRLTAKGRRWGLVKDLKGESMDASLFGGKVDDKGARKQIRASEKNPSEGIFLPDARKIIRDVSEMNPPNLGNKSDVLNNQDNITNINITASCSGSGEKMTPDWWPPDDIFRLCGKLTDFTDDEFEYVVADYRVFWLSDDGVSRVKPRSWGNNFKNSFNRSLQRLREAKALSTKKCLSRNTRDISISERLADRSWAQ